MTVHQQGQFLGQCLVRCFAASGTQGIGIFPQPSSVAPLRTFARFFDHVCPCQQVDCCNLVCLDSLDEVPLPGFEAVDPGLEGVMVCSKLGDDELSTPPIVDQGCHGGFGPPGIISIAIQQDTGDRVVSIRKYIGLNDDLLPNPSLD